MNPNAVEALKKWREENPEGVKAKTPLEKLQDKPTSLRQAITAFCWLCVGENRKDVTNCSATKCPLWNVRPYQKNSKEDNLLDS